MKRRLYSQADVDQIYDAALHVLRSMGMKVENRTCLEAMERFGAQIDYSRERAVMPKEALDRMLEIVQRENAEWDNTLQPVGEGYSFGGGGSCPFYYREDVGRRRATEDDCVEALKIAETSGVSGCVVPVLDGDVSAKYEGIRVIELAIRTLNRTRAGGTDLFHPEQIPFAVELGELYEDNPSRFLPAGNCPTSPLCVGKTIADLAAVKAPYTGTVYAVPVMPVMGANAPMTPEGTAVVGVAEILGGYVLAKSLNPETPVGATALCAMMDMQTGGMVYSAPEVLAADIAICETMEYCLNLPCGAFGTYIDAKLPGMRAMQEKLFRCLGSAAYSRFTEFSGTLDQGKVFSPTQMILDRDLHAFMAGYTRRVPIDDDLLGLDAILDVEWDGTGYLMHEHTMSHMRDIWRSAIFGRDVWMSLDDETAKEARHLERAQEIWRDNLAKYKPPDLTDDFLRDLADISERARKALEE